MEKIRSSEFISKKKEFKKQQQRKRRGIVLGLIMVTGLLIVNWKPMFASQSEMKTSADTMSRFIIAESQLQGENADLKEICKQAKKLDETGLKIVVKEAGFKTIVYFFKDTEPSLVQVAVLEIPTKR